MDVHNRDIIDRFVRDRYSSSTYMHLFIATCISVPYFSSIMDAREFEWESQLRFYWEQEPDELLVRQCTGSFGYGYEYMGLNGRLVITPLTDRIYLTLTQVIIPVINKIGIFITAFFMNMIILFCKQLQSILA